MASRILLRIPSLYHRVPVKDVATPPSHPVNPQVSMIPASVFPQNIDTKLIVSDRTYILGDNVRYIDFQNGRLLIHYDNGLSEELYNNKHEGETKKIYDMIIDGLKQNSSYMEYHEDDSCA